jgi:drug/metabolite transporter (DMT)-like permease
MGVPPQLGCRAQIRAAQLTHAYCTPRTTHHAPRTTHHAPRTTHATHHAPNWQVIEGQFWMSPISSVWLFGGAALIELPDMLRTRAWSIPVAHPLHFCLAASLGFCVNMAAFLVIKNAGSVMLKVLGTARNAGLVVFGAMVLGEAITPVELLGYALSLTAFGAYNYFRLKEM